MRTYVVLVLAALSGAVGETFLAFGMRRFGPMDWANPSRWLDLLLVVARNPWVLVGVVFAAGFFFLYLSALSWADLSFAMPITALSFVFAALFARFALGEEVSWRRWVGTLIIVAGVALVALDGKHRTALPGDVVSHDPDRGAAGGAASTVRGGAAP